MLDDFINKIKNMPLNNLTKLLKDNEVKFKSDICQSKVKCERITCANNISGICNSKEVQLKSVKIDDIDYLNCNSFDFE